MKLLYEIHKANKPEFPNFGDELNLSIWPSLAPELIDGYDSVLLVGIGTVLDENLPKEPIKVVMGTGCGYSHPPQLDKRFHIYCVRGPLTAEILGLPTKLAVTDPAILVHRLYRKQQEQRSGIALMGHYTSALCADWSFVCEELGLSYIHPLWPTEKVLECISKAELVVTEAMHGAIVADALRVPWVPVITSASACPFKWNDWTKSMGLVYDPIVLPALWDRAGPPKISMARLRRWVKQRQFVSRLKSSKLAARSVLSSDQILESRLDQLLELIDQMKLDAVREGWIAN